MCLFVGYILRIEFLSPKRLWCWEGLGAGGEGDDRGRDGWMASLTRWTSVWMNSGSWWWTGRPGVLWFMGSQRVGHDWATDLIWSDLIWRYAYLQTYQIMPNCSSRYTKLYYYQQYISTPLLSNLTNTWYYKKNFLFEPIRWISNSILLWL